MRTNARKLLVRCGAATTAAVVGLTVLAAHAPEARAEENSPTANKGKAAAGGALLGAEVVVIVESLAKVRSGTAYGIGAAAGAVAGGIGGFFVGQADASGGRISMYLLAGGLALVIPAIILTLNATRFQGNEEATEDKAPVNVNPPDPGKVGGSIVIGGEAKPTPPATSPTSPTTPPPTTPTPSPGPPGHGPMPGKKAPPPQSLFDVNGGSVRLGVPVPAVKSMWSTQEQKTLAVAQGTELRLPVLKVTF